MPLFPSLKEFLPQHYIKNTKIEKKIFQEHRKLMGTSEIDAKVRYVKLARGLPTFGVHFFLVKVRIIFQHLPSYSVDTLIFPVLISQRLAKIFDRCN